MYLSRYSPPMAALTGSGMSATLNHFWVAGLYILALATVRSLPCASMTYPPNKKIWFAAGTATAPRRPAVPGTGFSVCHFPSAATMEYAALVTAFQSLPLLMPMKESKVRPPCPLYPATAVLVSGWGIGSSSISGSEAARTTPAPIASKRTVKALFIASTIRPGPGPRKGWVKAAPPAWRKLYRNRRSSVDRRGSIELDRIHRACHVGQQRWVGRDQ